MVLFMMITVIMSLMMIIIIGANYHYDNYNDADNMTRIAILVVTCHSIS